MQNSPAFLKIYLGKKAFDNYSLIRATEVDLETGDTANAGLRDIFPCNPRGVSSAVADNSFNIDFGMPVAVEIFGLKLLSYSLKNRKFVDEPEEAVANELGFCIRQNTHCVKVTVINLPDFPDAESYVLAQYLGESYQLFEEV